MRLIGGVSGDSRDQKREPPQWPSELPKTTTDSREQAAVHPPVTLPGIDGFSPEPYYA